MASSVETCTNEARSACSHPGQDIKPLDQVPYAMLLGPSCLDAVTDNTGGECRRDLENKDWTVKLMGKVFGTRVTDFLTAVCMEGLGRARALSWTIELPMKGYKSRFKADPLRPVSATAWPNVAPREMLFDMSITGNSTWNC